MASQNAMSAEEMQNKIATARRDAEGLKDRIKRRKDELADTSREFPKHPLLSTPSAFSGCYDRAPVTNLTDP